MLLMNAFLRLFSIAPGVDRRRGAPVTRVTGQGVLLLAGLHRRWLLWVGGMIGEAPLRFALLLLEVAFSLVHAVICLVSEY